VVEIKFFTNTQMICCVQEYAGIDFDNCWFFSPKTKVLPWDYTKYQEPYGKSKNLEIGEIALGKVKHKHFLAKYTLKYFLYKPKYSPILKFFNFLQKLVFENMKLQVIFCSPLRIKILISCLLRFLTFNSFLTERVHQFPIHHVQKAKTSLSHTDFGETTGAPTDIYTFRFHNEHLSMH
jgi:hypothetical protein